MNEISVTIIALNEEADIKACLESVSWADDIIVSDTGSTDSTVEICRGRGARVFSDEWLGFGKQKNLCAGRARHDWILNVDADETVTPELKQEILSAVRQGGKSGYYIPRKNFFGQRWIRRCGWYPDYTLRLYRKDQGSFNERAVHESVTLKGKAGYLKNPLIHRTYEDIADYLHRMQRYSTLAAGVMLREGRNPGPLDLMLRPFFTFLKMFILKLGFLEGALGIVISMLYAGYTFSKYAKLWELKKNPAKAEQDISP